MSAVKGNPSGGRLVGLKARVGRWGASAVIVVRWKMLCFCWMAWNRSDRSVDSAGDKTR